MGSASPAAATGLLARSRDGVLLYGLTPPRGTISPEQADVVAEAAMDIFGLTELEICPWALREGVILERIDRISRSG